LTISYYRRKAGQADTLMQMGRWFGFRRGYKDLVRLYTTPGLYDAFDAICRDEQYFRDELRQYAVMVDGEPVVTPAEIPPLVASHMLRPTAAVKMYNAQLTERRSLGKEPSSGYPAKKDKRLAENIKAVLPLMDAVTTSVQILPGDVMTYRGMAFRSKCGVISHAGLLGVLTKLQWANEESFRADLTWLTRLGPKEIDEWVVVLPQPKAGRTASFHGRGPFGLHGRTCTETDGRIRGNSESKHRIAIRDEAAKPGNKTGYVLLYPVADKEDLPTWPDHSENPSEVVMAVSIRLPGSAEPRDGKVLKFQTKDTSKPRYSVIGD
jgi:hypothetical protein